MSLKLTGEDVAARRQSILSAATGVFLRYGYARTTMEDVAEAAGLSRPALYAFFPRKESIFAAVVKEMNNAKMAELHSATRSMQSFERKLHRYCEDWGSHSVELMQMHPDARDLFDISRPAVQEMYEEFIRFLAELLSEGMADSKLKRNPSPIARNLAFAMRGFKDAAKDGVEMRQMIAQEVDMLLAAIRD